MESRFIDEPFDEEERQLMEAVESGNFQSVPKEEFEATMREIRDGATAKVISIRMQGEDLRGIREMAKAAGMPYQTLINTLVHRYLAGTITFNEQF